MALPKYVVISASADGHIPFVECHLDSPFLIIDPGRIVSGLPMSYRFTGNTLKAAYGGQSLTGITAIWFRKPALALPAKGTQNRGYEEYTRHAMTLFLRLFYGMLPNALWVSNYYAMLRASDKLHQLVVAKRLGFNVPATIVTSSVVEAEEFVRVQEEAVVKPIEVKTFVLDGEQRIVLARKVNRRTMDFSGLHLAPAIVQMAIDSAEDIRVTVVGDQVFAATVRPKSPALAPSGVRDWRIGDYYDGTDIHPFELPKTIAKRCIEHVTEMGLQFGGIDLILDKKGTFWFLENNPNGQWAFIEEATGQPIGKALAQLLMTGKRSGRLASNRTQ